MRRPIIVAVLSAALLASAPAAAQGLREASPEELFATFKAICLDHIGDSDSQIATALSAPHDFELRETGEDGTKRYWTERYALSILPTDNQHYCMVTASVARSTSIASGGALLAPHVPKTARKESGAPNMVGWSDPHDGVLDSYFFVTRDNATGLLASFAAGRETPRSSAPN